MQAELDWKLVNLPIDNTTGNSYVTADGNVVLDGVNLEFAEYALAA